MFKAALDADPGLSPPDSAVFATPGGAYKAVSEEGITETLPLIALDTSPPQSVRIMSVITKLTVL